MLGEGSEPPSPPSTISGSRSSIPRGRGGLGGEVCAGLVVSSSPSSRTIWQDLEGAAAVRAKGKNQKAKGKNPDPELCLLVFAFCLDSSQRPVDGLSSAYGSGSAGLGREACRHRRPFRRFSLAIPHPLPTIASFQSRNPGRRYPSGVLARIPHRQMEVRLMKRSPKAPSCAKKTARVPSPDRAPSPTPTFGGIHA